MKQFPTRPGFKPGTLEWEVKKLPFHHRGGLFTFVRVFSQFLVGIYESNSVFLFVILKIRRLKIV